MKRVLRVLDYWCIPARKGPSWALVALRWDRCVECERFVLFWWSVFMLSFQTSWLFLNMQLSDAMHCVNILINKMWFVSKLSCQNITLLLNKTDFIRQFVFFFPIDGISNSRTAADQEIQLHGALFVYKMWSFSIVKLLASHTGH